MFYCFSYNRVILYCINWETAYAYVSLKSWRAWEESWVELWEKTVTSSTYCLYLLFRLQFMQSSISSSNVAVLFSDKSIMMFHWVRSLISILNVSPTYLFIFGRRHHSYKLLINPNHSGRMICINLHVANLVKKSYTTPCLHQQAEKSRRVEWEIQRISQRSWERDSEIVSP